LLPLHDTNPAASLFFFVAACFISRKTVVLVPPRRFGMTNFTRRQPFATRLS